MCQQVTHLHTSPMKELTTALMSYYPTFSDSTEPAKVTFVILNYNVTILTTNLIVKNFRAEAGLQKISKTQPTSTEIKLYL